MNYYLISRTERGMKEDGFNFSLDHLYNKHQWSSPVIILRLCLKTTSLSHGAGIGINQSTNNSLEDVTYATQLRNPGVTNTGKP